MECALQHLYEAKWLINYTDDWTSAEAALDACEKSVQDVSQPRVVQADVAGQDHDAALLPGGAGPLGGYLDCLPGGVGFPPPAAVRRGGDPVQGTAREPC